MAITRKPIVSFQLGQIVKSRIETFVFQRERARAIKESDFDRRVMDEGLAYEDQKTHWENVLKYEKDRFVPDLMYIKEIKGNISSYKKLVRAEKFSNQYRTSLNELAQGFRSLDSHVSFLKNELTDSFDPELKELINTKLTEAFEQQSTAHKAIFENQIKFAQEDDTNMVLSEMIGKVKSKIAEVTEVGDEQYESSLKLSLQSLEKQVEENKIEKSINDTTIELLSDNNPVSRLNSYNRALANARADIPVTINGTKYENAKSYWEGVKNNYLGSGQFFDDLSSYYKNKIDGAEVRSKEVLPIVLGNYKDSLETLVNKPDFMNYQDQLRDTIDLTVNYGAAKVGKEIVDKSKTDYNFQGAVNELERLSKRTGVDLTENYRQVIDEVANLNAQQAQEIYANALATAREQGRDTPNDVDLAWAVKATPSGAISPEELATQKPEETLKQQREGEGRDVTIEPTKPAPFKGAVSGGKKYEEGALIKIGASPTVYRLESGKIRPFVGSWTEESFKAQAGKTFKDVQEVENLGGFSKGKAINLKQATLWSPDKATHEIVSVGTKRASELQTQGWTLTK